MGLRHHSPTPQGAAVVAVSSRFATHSPPRRWQRLEKPPLLRWSGSGVGGWRDEVEWLERVEKCGEDSPEKATGKCRGGSSVACDDEVEVMMRRRLEMVGVATAYLPEKGRLENNWRRRLWKVVEVRR
ncbi:hypothetical protein Tco_1085062 [Tanacetum coccineum]